MLIKVDELYLGGVIGTVGVIGVIGTVGVIVLGGVVGVLLDDANLQLPWPVKVSIFS